MYTRYIRIFVIALVFVIILSPVGWIRANALQPSSDGASPANHLISSQKSSESFSLADCNTTYWLAAQPYPQTIARYAFGQVGDDIYVFGGVSNGLVVNTVRRYSLSTNSWTDLAVIPASGEALSAAYWNGKFYVTQGLGGSAFQIYDIATNTWAAAAPVPVSNTYGAAIGAYNGQVYLVGGFILSPSSDAFRYDISTNTWSASTDAPAEYYLGGYTQVGKYLYLVGSFGSAPLSAQSELPASSLMYPKTATEAAPDANGTTTMRLDMTTGSWSTGPAWSMARADFALASDGAKLYAIGGDVNGNGFFDPSTEVDQYSLSSWPGGAWAISPPALPSPRQGNQAGFFTHGLAGGEIWSTGGLGSGFVFTNEHLYRPYVTTTWLAAQPYPQTIVRYAFGQVGDDIYIFGGVSDGSRVSNVRRYSLSTNTWTDLAPLPAFGEAPSAAYWNGKFYVTQGDLGQAFQIYDIATNTWSSAAPVPPTNTYGASIGAYNDMVFLVGGGTSGPGSTATYLYNISTNTWNFLNDAPASYYLGGYTQVGKYLYLVGSFGSAPLNAQSGSPASSVLNPGASTEAAPEANGTTTMRLDMTTGTWSTGPAWTMARADFALASDGVKLYAIGGDVNGGGFFNPSTEVDEYSLSSWPGGAWAISSPALPSPRQGNQAGFFTHGLTGGEIWSTGGLGSGFVFMNEHLYRPHLTRCFYLTPVMKALP